MGNKKKSNDRLELNSKPNISKAENPQNKRNKRRNENGKKREETEMFV